MCYKLSALDKDAMIQGMNGRNLLKIKYVPGGGYTVLYKTDVDLVFMEFMVH